MDMLKSSRRFQFLYGGKQLEEYDIDITQTLDQDTLTTVYTFTDGLKVTNIARKYGKYGAYEWVNWFENASAHPTEIISGLWDCHITLPMAHEEVRRRTAFLPELSTSTLVYAPTGSTWCTKEFYCKIDDKATLSPGMSKEFKTSGGRSSEAQAPFFNVHKEGRGYLFAIGWTGQWKCSISRGEDDITFKSGLEDTHFRLMPGEKIRTSSVVMMPYEGTVTESQNKWRRLVKEQFSPVGTGNRDKQLPFCAGIWGGMTTESVLKRINIIKKAGIPFDYVWMDAGWYGTSDKSSPDEFEGDWSSFTGDWRVNPLIHPDGLKDVSKAIHDAGMKFLLWFEPERVIRTMPEVRVHPEYFLKPEDDKDSNLLLNLGDPDAWEYCFCTLAGLIEELNIDCYRQDFNFPPLKLWRINDTDDRRGMTEIKHIMGMYRLWDALLERFPQLLIDNCASGGRRIDIETLRRSVPLWRSDAQCPANYPCEVAQAHTLNFNAWMPYSGTGTGRFYDTYRMRSAYGAGMTTNYTFSEKDTFGDDEEKLVWLKKCGEEFVKLRPYYSEDFYPLAEATDRLDVWSAVQFDRPSDQTGIIQVFRRENAPYDSASYSLGGVKEGSVYTFTDADDGKSIMISGQDLKEKGFPVKIETKRTAKIYLYSYK